MKPLIQLRKTRQLFATALALVCFVLCSAARAVVPPPDGGYPNFTTAEGTHALLHLTSGTANTGLGWSSLLNITTGSFNTGVGAGTLALNTADSNTATGTAALLLNTTGTENTANGTAALLSNSNGISNSAFGAFALNNNVDGNSNTAIGDMALLLNSNGGFNTATGSFALASNIAGSNNTAVGAGALESNTGDENTAVGSAALLFNTMGLHNTATGFQALMLNTANDNTAYGYQALANNTTAEFNTAFGYHALLSNVDAANTAVGFRALFNKTTGMGNIALGASAGDQITTGNNNIDIDNDGQFSDSDTTRIGQLQTATYIAAISGGNEGGSNILPVYINNLGRLGTQPPPSSRRFKHNIKPMENASDVIFSLRPVAFQYKDDRTNTPQFGLVAEEVAAVDADLVVRDEEGNPYTVRYDQVNAMLLNEFLKEHEKVNVQQKQIDALTVQLKQQEARIQKISNQLEITKATARLAETGR